MEESSCFTATSFFYYPGQWQNKVWLSSEDYSPHLLSSDHYPINFTLSCKKMAFCLHTVVRLAICTQKSVPGGVISQAVSMFVR